VSVLKIGSDMLAGLVSHVVNMSFLARVFPSAFKTALIHPVYKWYGKARNKAHMAVNNNLPTSQHGFRRGKSCTTALATAHTALVAAKAKRKVGALVGFDLSAAFDTVGREDLLPKMEAMGIRGKSIGWFRSYLTGARQRVVWYGQVSEVVDMEYGVRQGSLLGLVLYLLHVCDGDMRSMRSK
jgi:hypothetical protein